MSHFGRLTYYSSRTTLLILLIFFGFISSRALISIGTALLALNLLLSYKEHQWRFIKIRNLNILIAILFFFISVLFLFISPDLELAVRQLYYSLPWLVIPLSIAAMAKPKLAVYHVIMSFFIFVITISGIVVLINYFSNYSYYTDQIALAKNIPTPLNHIRYSLMVAFAGLVSVYFWVKNTSQLSPYDRKLFAFSSLFLFVLIHILSVRSGLLCYYLGLTFLIFHFTFHFRKYWILPVFGLLLLLMPFVAYHTIPSVQSKVAYMRWDIEQLKLGKINHNSDGRRWRSIVMATELTQESWVLGHGAGQVENVSKGYYLKNYPDVEEHNQKVPHNQFLYTLVEMGGVGLLVVILILFFPLVSSYSNGNPLFVVLWIIIVASCLVENTLESQIGMSFYLLLGSLLLKQGQDE